MNFTIENGRENNFFGHKHYGQFLNEKEVQNLVLLPFKNLFFFFLFALWYSVNSLVSLYYKRRHDSHLKFHSFCSGVHIIVFLSKLTEGRERAKLLYNLIAVYQLTVLISVRPPDSSDMNSFIVFILLNPLCIREEG